MKANRVRSFKPAATGRRFKPKADYSGATPGEHHHLYNNTRWIKYRRWFLLHHPLCAACEKRGSLITATVVDHIIPHRGDNIKFWAADNHQALCASCHGSKSSSERIGAKRDRGHQEK